jgi:hypothetical protein
MAVTPMPLTRQPENLSDNLCGRLVHNKLLLILLGALVAIGDRAAAPHAVLHPDLNTALILLLVSLGYTTRS